jgi:hypothetical protein
MKNEAVTIKHRINNFFIPLPSLVTMIRVSESNYLSALSVSFTSFHSIKHSGAMVSLTLENKSLQKSYLTSTETKWH